MEEPIILSDKEISDILKDIDKKYHLEIYRILRSSKLSNKINKKDVKELKAKIVNLLKQKNLPRKLTDNEIKNILGSLPLLPATIKKISEDNLEQVKEKLTRQLKSLNFSITTGTIEKIKNKIRESYLKSVCPAGESVGINGAMAIGQPLTQANLNTFHKTGTQNTNETSLEYIKKLFDVSKSKEVMKTVVHFKNKDLTREEINIIGKSLKGINVYSLINNTEILDSLSEEDKKWYENYFNVMGKKFVYKGDKFLRIYLNINKCYKYDIFISDIVKTIEKNSRCSELKYSVKCIASASFVGIIDVHVNKEYIKISIDKFSKQVIKNKLPPTGKIEDLTAIFLNTLILDNLKNMLIKGIKNIERVSVSETINLILTFNDNQHINERDLEKFTKSPFKLKLQDAMRIWYIKINKEYLLFKGITKEKYIRFFKEAGIDILEDFTSNKDPYFTILMPKKIDIKYYNKEENKSFNRYLIDKDNHLYDDKLKKRVYKLGPKKFLEQKIEYIKEILYQNINKILLNENDNFKDDMPYIEPLYRYGNYNYAIIEGGKIIKDLFNNANIDKRFTYPDNVNDVYNIFGIEAARFYLTNKYNVDTTKNINSINIDLIIDFQTALGKLLPVNSMGVSKLGSSLLTSVSFEKAMEFFEKGSAFGTLDEIKGISSCIMTGSKCRNGTGIVKTEFSKQYLDNKDNITPEDIVKNIKMDTDTVTGACYSTAPKDLRNDYGREDIEDDPQFNMPLEGKKPELRPKEIIPGPPRMEPPDFILQELKLDLEEEKEVDLDLEKEYGDVKNDWDINDIIDTTEIPEEPSDMLDEDI